jgi:hypothetical protein
MTNQPTTCAPATASPDRTRLLTLIAGLLVAIASMAFSHQLDAGDPWSSVRAILRGPHATQEHLDGAGADGGADVTSGAATVASVNQSTVADTVGEVS